VSGTPREIPLPYGTRLGPVLEPLHRWLIPANRLIAPLLRLGLGAFISNPITGYLLLLRTRGSRTGTVREVPLGYVVLDGAVYCCAGFGTSAAWYRNVLARSRVQVVLPGRTFEGRADPVADPAEWLRAYRALMASLGVVSRAALGDIGAMDDAALLEKHRSLPLVRITPTAILSGPLDPGGRWWLVALLAWLAVLGIAARHLTRKPEAARQTSPGELVPAG
jgi:deazaflavin-dependent oxidoreductase (nitroreductase family)